MLAIVLLSAMVPTYASSLIAEQEQHALLNKIWDISDRKFISETVLLEKLLNARTLLLGEIHDNPQHHKYQAMIINHLSKKYRSASVSFEMITQSQSELLQQNSYQTSDELIALLNKEDNNWSYSKLYKNVFDAVLHAGFEVRPANLATKQLMAYTMKREQEIPPALKQIISAAPFTDRQKTALQKEIISGHCNMIPAESTGPMVTIQRIRDALMAQSLLGSRADIKILIAGAGHTRKDRGVPFYLSKQKQSGNLVSLAFLEIQQGNTQISDYYQRWDSQQLPFDYVWFTKRTERGDPCEKLRKKFQHKQND